MKAFFLNIYKVLRTLIVFGIVAFVTVFVALYLVLLIPSIQHSVKETVEIELTKLLNTDVSIDELSISPFNKVVLTGVNVYDLNEQQLLNIDKLGLGFSLYNLVARHRVVFTHAEIVGLKGNVYKENGDSPLNIQFIIDAFRPKEQNKEPQKYDLAIYNIVLRRSEILYNVLNEDSDSVKFDKNHIRISDLRADISMPKLKNDDFYIKIKRLSFKEQSGFNLKNFSISAKVNDTTTQVADLRVELPNSYFTTQDFSVSYKSLKTLGDDFADIDWSVNTSDSYVTLSDLSAFFPLLSKFDERLYLTMVADGSLNSFELLDLIVEGENKELFVETFGKFTNLTNPDLFKFNMPHVILKSQSGRIKNILNCIPKLSTQAENIIVNSGKVAVDSYLSGTLSNMYCVGHIDTDNGKLKLNGTIISESNRDLIFKGQLLTENYNLGQQFGMSDLLGETSFNIDVNVSKCGSDIDAKLGGNVNYIDFKGYRYKNITADLVMNPFEYKGVINMSDENISLQVNANAVMKKGGQRVDLDLNVAHCNLNRINLIKKYPNHKMSFNLSSSVIGDLSENCEGFVNIEDFKYVDITDEGIKLDNIKINANNENLPYVINVDSDVLKGELKGEYNVKTIVPTIQSIVMQLFPALQSSEERDTKIQGSVNDFCYSFCVENNDVTNNLLTFFESPITILYPIKLNGTINERKNTLDLDISAPYILQKKKLIEDTKLTLSVDSVNRDLTMNIHTMMPSKKGKIAIDVCGTGSNNRLNTEVSWKIDRKEAFYGSVDLSLMLGRVNETDKLMVTLDVNPTNMVFNDTIWNVHHSRIGFYNKSIRVNDFKVTSDNQFVRINGRSEPESDDKIEVELKDINLGYIFETLQINNVTFGGVATGKIAASNLLSPTPRLATERFHVEGMTYNGSMLGNADMESYWDNEDKYVAIKALIKQNNDCESKVDGRIYPMRDSMSFDFDTHKLKVGFMKPFMSAITSDLDGYVSGKARLYGRFSTLNMYGDVYVDDLKIKVDYTNVYYSTSDSIKILPGEISFKDVQIKDRNGKTAALSGKVLHDDFRNAKFEFNVTDANEILCYDIPERRKDPWYGTIYGTGTTFINGEPGFVGIDVRMQTATGSKFYFELSDSRDAVEYDFITFTDNRKDSIEAEKLAQQTEHEKVLMNYEKKIEKFSSANSSRMAINIEADINPLGQLYLIMDPVSGDKIKATGNGNLVLKYDTRDELYMSGKYTLDKGTYNFTLQDIIVKDFTIKDGSSIAFEGNPYAAKVDISAIYSLNANLLDLDESFATDKEFNRTNVPVYAVLNVTGAIAEPEVTFDLEFPTLTNDAYRKVKSIVSTDDMMNRQIIYLLALNRFYTPEYMGGTNKNNELASVASSTLSSQLSSMLGQISDNWQISPNFKSDRGDFSDVEVNLALSSQLLNNRLLLNGNFGYRDKMVTANNSNFIGDFDIEYLLNKTGSVRLKAYNHFNDQNYYVKNALTTQGAGVVFKFDFDNPFETFRKKKKQTR